VLALLFLLHHENGDFSILMKDIDILGYYTTGIVMFWAKAHRLDT
jgi:hypothetical protein